MALRSVSLCSGIEGLGLGIDLATQHLGLGPVEPVLYVEREAFPASVLVSRMEDQAIPPAPIWSDLGTVTGPECGDYLREVGRIDLVFGGIPCQPWSVAGKQAGTDDERDLWPLVEGLVEFLDRPEWVFLENVSGFAVWDGLGRVGRSLQGMGYRVAAILLGAGDVGASHRRKRLFVLAHAEGAERSVSGGARAGREGLADDSAGLANASRQGPQGGGEGLCGSASGNLGDTGRKHSDVLERVHGAEYSGASLPLFAPGPADFDAWARVLEIDPGLAPATQPGLRGVADVPSERVERLRALGNGVVPISAAVAFVALCDALQ